MTLELTPCLARLFLDSLRAVYDVEVQRLANAATEHVRLPLRQIPTLRHFITDAERQLGKPAPCVNSLLDASEKRIPRSVKST